MAIKLTDNLKAHRQGYAKAFDILKTSFEINEIGWAHTDNKYKMFLGAFQQLEETIKRN